MKTFKWKDLFDKEGKLRYISPQKLFSKEKYEELHKLRFYSLDGKEEIDSSDGR